MNNQQQQLNWLSKLLYRALPKPTYLFVSNIIQRLLQYTNEIQNDIDPNTIFAVRMGFLLGILLITTLSFFPGNGNENKSTQNNNDNSHDNNTKQDSGTGTTSFQNKKNEPTWSGDELSPELLEKTRKKFNLTHEQMDKVIQQSKEQALMGYNSTMSSSTIHDQEIGSSSSSSSLIKFLNRLVYMVFFSFFLYYVISSENQVILRWFVTNFPRESKTLGLTKVLRDL